MIIRPSADIVPSEITDKSLYLKRREFLQLSAATGLATLVGGIFAPREAHALTKLNLAKKATATAEDPLTPLRDVTSYNNFYEFGTDKADPAAYASTLKTRPWTVAVEGEVKRPKVYDIDELLKLAPLEERIYRLRCVEGWSMVIPWIGYSLSELIKRVEPTGKAKFVEFTTLQAPDQMPGQKTAVLNWPYVEGTAFGRGDASARAARCWAVWRSVTEPKRRAGAHRGAVEIWL